MKRSLRIVFSGVLVALSMLLTSCRGDWYYELPNDYVAQGTVLCVDNGRV